MNPWPRTWAAGLRRLAGSKMASEGQPQDAIVRRLADTVPGAILGEAIVSAGTVRFAYLNAGVERVLGIPVSEVMVDPTVLCALIGADDLARLRSVGETALRTMSSFDLEIRPRTMRGDVRCLQVRAVAPRVLPDGAAVWSGVAIDITDRKVAEEALFDRELQLRNLGDNLPDGVIYQVVRRPDGSNYFPYMSSGLERAFGLRQGQATTDPSAIYRLILPEDLLRLRSAADASIRTGEPFDVHCRLRAPDGALRWFQLRGRPRPLADGSTLWDAIALDVTERRRIEEISLRESEERFRAVFEQAAVGLAVMAPDGRFFRVNERLCAMLGYRADELQARRFQDVTHPDDLEVSLARRKLLLAGEAPPYSLAKRYLRKDGTVVWIELTLSPVTELGGEPGHSIAIIQDISARMAAERALRDSEASFRFMFTGSALPMWVFDRETLAFLEVNEAAVRAHGHARDEFLAMRITDICPPADVVRLHAWLATEQSTVPRDAGQWQHRLKDGQIITVHVTSQPIDFKGTPARLVIAEDITERIAAEHALRESEERFRATFEQAAVGITIVADDGRFLRVNQRFCDMVGYAAEELAGLTFLDITHPEDRDRNVALRQPIVEGRAPTYSIEKRYVRKDGGTIWVSVTASQARNAPEAHAYSIGIVQDITHAKELEREIQHAQRMDAVGRLAGGIAHDFNNLLTVIGGRSELVRRQLHAKDPLRREIDLICETSARAALLTRQLLAFSRKQVLQPKIIAINELLAHSTNLLRRLIGEDIDFGFVPAANAGRVRVDPGQLEQVIVNLAVNARDAMPMGGRLTVETANAEVDATDAAQHIDVTPGCYVMLAVSDTGTGMTPDVQARIFEPFFSTKGPGKGMGLGLATVYGIVKQSGGHVRVRSEVGQGTTFTIYLPRTEAAAERLAPTTRQSVPGGTETVLLVEDEAEVRSLTREILEALGYTVLEAATPERARLIAREHVGNIHLLLTDVIMPLMSGPALGDLIISERPATKVLFMSGYTDDAITRHGVPDREANLMEKPFTSQALAAKVRAVLDAVGT